MNNRRIEKMIVPAMEILKEKDTGILKKDTIPSKFNGYIASFGPSVVQAGMLQTLAFYSRDDGEGKERKKINALIRKTLIESEYLKKSKNNSLLDALKDKLSSPDSSERIYWKTLVLEASVACKLAMRTFLKGDCLW